jgi:hypothetical protein
MEQRWNDAKIEWYIRSREGVHTPSVACVSDVSRGEPRLCAKDRLAADASGVAGVVFDDFYGMAPEQGII